MSDIHVPPAALGLVGRRIYGPYRDAGLFQWHPSTFDVEKIEEATAHRRAGAEEKRPGPHQRPRSRRDLPRPTLGSDPQQEKEQAMDKVIEAWEGEDGDCVVIGTHDRIEGMIHLQKWFKEELDMTVNNTHFAGVRSYKRWARPDWEALDEGESVIADYNTGIPMLIFDEGVSYAWDKRLNS